MDFKTLRGPNGTKSVIVIDNKNIVYEDARDARFGPAAKNVRLGETHCRTKGIRGISKK